MVNVERQYAFLKSLVPFPEILTMSLFTLLKILSLLFYFRQKSNPYPVKEVTHTGDFFSA